jgi:tetratricopeptide (TPR) repeat protein
MSELEVQAYKLMTAGRIAEALPLAQSAVAAQRVCTPTHGMLATILLQLGRRHDAELVIQQALEYQQGSADAYDALAHVSALLGQHERANALYRRIVEMAPHDPRFWHNLASSERSLGRLREAEAACDRTIALDREAMRPDELGQGSSARDRNAVTPNQHGRRNSAGDRTRYATFLLRSELRIQTSDANHVEELQRELSLHGADDRARMFLGYALAKELDDLQRYDEAFPHLVAASAIRRRHLAYDVAMDRRKLERIAAVFPKELVRDDAAMSPKEPIGHDAAMSPKESIRDGATGAPKESIRHGATGSRHIFIVGLPRSGTTLLEHMLLGLSDVRSNGETENFSQALLAAALRDRGDVFAGAAAADPAAVARGYEQLAAGDSNAGWIIEKLPMNYLYLGAIHRALPGAKLVLVNRDPVDSCFAMYRILFGKAYPFSYDFDDLAKYYAAYERLMDHWRACLGDALYEVTYEDLVKDPSKVGAGVAAYCGLEWHEGAVEVHKRASVSLTASAAQVRRPIYGSSSGRWRRYEKHLEPLIQALRRERVI